MKRRNKRRKSNPFHFAKLEPRQLLAGDLGELNLLTNGDFSEVPTAGAVPDFYDSADVAGWNATNVADGQQIVLYTFGTGDDANTVLKLDSTADQVDYVFQDVATTAGETYLLTFDLQGQNPGELVVENVEVFWNGEQVGLFESTGIWTTHAMVVTGAAEGDSTLEFREAADGSTLSGDGIGVLIDNVNVALATATTGVTNGSFETVTGDGPFFSNGNVEGWNALERGDRPDLIQIQPNGDNDNAAATDGSQVLNLDTTSDVVDHVFADFATVEGQTYFVTFDMFADGDQSTDADEVRIRWKSPDADIQTDQWIATVFGNNTWQSYGFMVTGLGDVSRLELREPAGSPGDGSGALIDNVQLFSVEGIINDLVVDANGTADGTSATAELVQGQTRASVAESLTLDHASGSNLTSATITITDSPSQPEDSLEVTPGDSGITSSFNPASGTLTLTGNASVATWQTVLRTLEYVNSNTSQTIGTRSLSIVVSDDSILGDDKDSTAATVGVDVVANELAMAAIEVQTVEAGSPLWVTLDVSNPADVALQYTGESGDASLLTPRFETGDSWRLNISAPDVTTNGVATPLEGEITFQLFDNIFGSADARATDRITTLTNDGFFDDTQFHRVDSDFVIQGGDPTATGTGGSDLGDFDDQFSTLLQHNRTGLLSYAKSLDDTNDSQFFITDTATRFLDYQHTIFGVLTSGEDLRESIANVDIGTDPNNVSNSEFPTGAVTITSAEIYQDNQRAALLLVAPEGVTGETTMTVTARDVNGNETSQTITVNIVAPTGDNVDSNPFLDDIPDLAGFYNVQQTYQLTSQDVENDSVRYLDLAQIETINEGLSSFFQIQVPQFDSDDSFDYSVDIDTGLVTYTPGEFGDSPETVQFIVGVAQEPRDGEPINNGNVDLQVVTITLSQPSSL
ncbi:peptidylprolyl isomerase [Mariniblastus fucicola]|nr:peptidylprolyl isomerase [Mariniblastus fucicola]